MGRSLSDEQLEAMYEVCHWVMAESTEPYNYVPWGVFCTAVGFVTEHKEEVERGTTQKD